MFWRRVAERFAGNGYVLGYELINEPWAGDIYSHPEQLEARKFSNLMGVVSPTQMFSSPPSFPPDIADSRNLQPLYQRLHSAIRQEDQNHILFFEPTVIITNVGTTLAVA